MFFDVDKTPLLTSRRRGSWQLTTQEDTIMQLRDNFARVIGQPFLVLESLMNVEMWHMTQPVAITRREIQRPSLSGYFVTPNHWTHAASVAEVVWTP